MELEDNSFLNSPYSKTNIQFEKHLDNLRMTSSNKRPLRAFNPNKSVDFNKSCLVVDHSDFSHKSNTEGREEIRLPYILAKDTLNQINKSQQGIMD